METLDLDNRRRARRFNKQVPITYRTSTGEVGAGVTLNVSKTGARVLFYRDPGDDQVVLDFYGFELAAQTVWEQPWDGRQCVVAGVHFVDQMGPIQRAGLEYLLRSPN